MIIQISTQYHDDGRGWFIHITRKNGKGYKSYKYSEKNAVKIALYMSENRSKWSHLYYVNEVIDIRK